MSVRIRTCGRPFHTNIHTFFPQDKIERPELDLWHNGGPVIGTILQLIKTEGGAGPV